MHMHMLMLMLMHMHMHMHVAHAQAQAHAHAHAHEGIASQAGRQAGRHMQRQRGRRVAQQLGGQGLAPERAGSVRVCEHLIERRRPFSVLLDLILCACHAVSGRARACAEGRAAAVPWARSQDKYERQHT